MDRKALREFTHKGENFLTIDNGNYKQWVFRYTFLELEKDLFDKGDITSNGMFHSRRQVKATIFAREPGVLAGKQEIEYFLKEADAAFRPRVPGEFDLKFFFNDGDEFKTDDALLEIGADVHDLLAVERTCLNLLMRMSGVATHTKSVIDLVSSEDVLVTPTRKTLWGLLDKRAVMVAGGGSHRINLSDAILIKDTHLDLVGRDFEKVFQNIADSGVNPRFLEIEILDPNEAVNAAGILARFISEKKLRTIGVILLDNMGPEKIVKSMEALKKAGLYDDLLFEASGGINKDTALTYAQTGVDIISLGSITNGPRSLNMSMKIS